MEDGDDKDSDFPFLSISTGHHHVADSLQTELLLKSHHCEKSTFFTCLSAAGKGLLCGIFVMDSVFSESLQLGLSSPGVRAP